MRRTPALVVGLLVGLFIVATEGSAQPLVVYDNFNGPLISATKWLGRQGGNILEATRRLELITPAPVNRALVMEARGYAGTTSNSGSEFPRYGLSFPRPNAVSSLQATMRVQAVQLVGCAGNRVAAQVRSRLSGSFFNAGPGSPVPGSSNNDVIARLHINRLSNSRDPADRLRVRGDAIKCEGTHCQRVTGLGFVRLGTVQVGQDVTLRMDWDAAGNRFLFKLNANPAVPLRYSVPDSSPPGLPYKNVQIAHTVPRCTSLPRPTAFMRVRFDNVLVNASALRWPDVDASGDDPEAEADWPPED